MAICNKDIQRSPSEVLRPTQDPPRATPNHIKSSQERSKKLHETRKQQNIETPEPKGAGGMRPQAVKIYALPLYPGDSAFHTNELLNRFLYIAKLKEPWLKICNLGIKRRPDTEKEVPFSGSPFCCSSVAGGWNPNIWKLHMLHMFRGELVPRGGYRPNILI
jgi:hypothetical protein